MERLDACSHHLRDLLGAGAFNDAALQRFLEPHRGLQLLAPTKVNQRAKRSGQAQKQLNRLRLLCEPVKAQVQEQLHLSKHYAKSRWGLVTRSATKLTAHCLGMMVKAFCGPPLLRLADLAV